MALSSLLDLLGIVDISSWRLVVPTAAGIGAGLGVYYLSGESPAAAAVAFALWLLGFAVGIIWHVSHSRRR